MAHEIAVILDKSGNTATLSVQGKVVLFSRKMGEWKISRVREFTLSDVQGMSDLRCKMDELKEFLGDCSNFVALKMEGLPGSILEKTNAMFGSGQEIRLIFWTKSGYPLNNPQMKLRNQENSKIAIP